MTACAPLCGLADARRVNKPQSIANAAVSKACGRCAPSSEFSAAESGRGTGGAKKVQDKGRGSLTRPPASHTAPQSGSGIFHRWSEFQLFAVAGGRYQEIQRENLSVSPFCKVAVVDGFPEFHGSRCGGHFLPPGGKSGVTFSSALTATAKLAGPGGDICKNLRQPKREQKCRAARFRPA